MADGKVVIDVILDDGSVVKGVTNIDRGFKGLMSTAKSVAASIGKIAAGIGAFELARKAVNMVTSSLDGAIARYDTLNNFPKVMQQIGFSSEESGRAIQRLSDGIQGLPTTLDSVASTAQRIAVMTNDLDGAVETTLALNNAFIASGASQQDAARGLEQYVQMLAKGEVDLQSWRTLQETMGVALNDVAKAFGFAGKSAQNDLYDALKSGKITFDEFNAKIIELSNAQGGFAERALTASGGIRTAWTNMQTAVVRGVTSIIEAIDNVLADTPLESIENIIVRIGKAFFNILNSIAEAIPVVANWLMSVKEAIDPLIPSVNQVRDGFTSAFETIKAAVMPIVQEVVSFIMTTWGNMVAWWQENGTQITQAVQNAFQFILAVVQAVMPAVKFIIEMVWENIKNIISSALNIIMNLVNLFAGLFTGNWQQVWASVKQIFLSALTLLWNLFQLWGLGRILKFVGFLGGQLGRVFRAMWDGVRNIFSSALNRVFDVVKGGFNRVLDWVFGLGKRFFDAGKGLIEMVKRGIENAADMAVNAVKNLVKKIRDFLPFSPAKKGPLRDLDKLDFGGTISDSINRGRGAALKAMQGLAAQLRQEVSPEVAIENRLRGAALPFSSLMPAAAVASAYGAELKAASGMSRAEFEMLTNAIRQLASRPVVVEMDGRQIVYATVDLMDETLKFKQQRTGRFRG